MASILSRLFGSGSGGGEAKTADPVEHKGFTIIAAPRSDGGQWITAGTISKDVGGELRSHDFIRADRHTDRDSAVEYSTRKAKQIIDEQGDRLFDQ